MRTICGGSVIPLLHLKILNMRETGTHEKVHWIDTGGNRSTYLGCSKDNELQYSNHERFLVLSPESSSFRPTVRMPTAVQQVTESQQLKVLSFAIWQVDILRSLSKQQYKCLATWSISGILYVTRDMNPFKKYFKIVAGYIETLK